MLKVAHRPTLHLPAKPRAAPSEEAEVDGALAKGLNP
jgi:hypothetical protein